MDIQKLFQDYREAGHKGWGLAWFLAAEICRRFYVSHGIRPVPFTHEGLGYYGIMMCLVPCHVHRKANTGLALKPIGRFTITGNVENWETGHPGDHGLELVDRAYKDREPLSKLVQATIDHMRFPGKPAHTHMGCRHHRRGASYVLLFDLIARLALEHENDFWFSFEPHIVKRKAEELDPKFKQAEDPGYIWLNSKENDIFLHGDGQVFLPEKQPSLWDRYMAGESEEDLYQDLERWLGFRSR
ncbi:hypothetical protein KQI52_06680 [bacterium]|nr:hypothetical protein [bacterium]